MVVCLVEMQGLKVRETRLVNVEGPAPNPIAILFEELPEKFDPAFCPNAILLHPTVLQHKAARPIAALLHPVVLKTKALKGQFLLLLL